MTVSWIQCSGLSTVKRTTHGGNFARSPNNSLEVAARVLGAEARIAKNDRLARVKKRMVSGCCLGLQGCNEHQGVCPEERQNLGDA
jgi:hypothetical protein